MNHTDGWTHGWMDGGAGGSSWILPMIGIVIVVLLFVVIINQSKK